MLPCHPTRNCKLTSLTNQEGQPPALSSQPRLSMTRTTWALLLLVSVLGAGSPASCRRHVGPGAAALFRARSLQADAGGAVGRSSPLLLPSALMSPPPTSDLPPLGTTRGRAPGAPEPERLAGRKASHPDWTSRFERPFASPTGRVNGRTSQ